MRRIYQARDLQQAHLLLHRLQQAGIRARVFNENAQGAIGQIPFTDTYPELWLEREADRERAEALIREFEAEPVVEGEVRCPHCGESHPANFELCWHCGRSLAGR